MAGKFVDLAEAARMIGVPPEELVEMRSKGNIFGYRDGASWKFKVDEVERVIRERGVDARDSDSGILNAGEDEFDAGGADGAFAGGVDFEGFVPEGRDALEPVGVVF